MQQGQPMIIMGEDAQRVKDRDAQEYNISAAREMIVEVAETQEDEAGDGTTSAVAVAGELLKNAEDLLEQDIHPTAVIKGFNLASEFAREEVDDVATTVDPEDTETLKNVAETSMTGKGAELEKEVLADLVVRSVQGVTVEADDGSHVVDLQNLNIETRTGDLQNLNIETRTGRSAGESRLLSGAVVDKDPVHDDMPTDFEEANVVLLNDPIEVEEADVDTSVNVDSPEQLQQFLDQEEAQLREKVDQIVDAGADVVFCQKGIDDLAQHYLAKRRRASSPCAGPRSPT
jgi:chaperonin GroEL (HSP60 family)